MKITICGHPGAGKTTLAKMLSKKLNLKLISSEIRRNIATKRKVTINELMKLSKTEPEIHDEIDSATKKFGKENNNFIIESWLGYHFIPDSFKIFLYISPEIGAKRIYKNQRKEEPKYSSIRETQKKIKERILDTQESFYFKYKINYLKKENFDLIINTTNLTLEEVSNKILEAIQND